MESSDFVKTAYVDILSTKRSNGEDFSGLLAKSYRQCPSEAKTYAMCVHRNVSTLRQDLCVREIKVLMDCIKKHTM